MFAEESQGNPPIKVKFEIPYFTVSGIQVRIFNVFSKVRYMPYPGLCLLWYVHLLPRPLPPMSVPYGVFVVRCSQKHLKNSFLGSISQDN